MIILGISDSLTSGAALVVDGEIRAVVSEERLCRLKMAMGFPYRSIDEVLRIAGVRPDQIDAVAVATRDLYWRAEPRTMDGFFDADWGATKEVMLRLSSVFSRLTAGNRVARKSYYRLKSRLTRNRHRELREELTRRWNIEVPVEFVDHHLAHAACAFFGSGFDRATVATLDGAGDGVSARIYRIREGRFERLVEVDSFDSIGNYYSYVTHLCGFKAHRHEGKITGLASFGEPEYADLLRSMVHYADGRIVNSGKAYHTAAIRKLRQHLPEGFTRENLAASMQLVLEEATTAFVDHWLERSGEGDLALAGGVVANVKLNQCLHDLDRVRRISVHPGMGDEGLALGAAWMLSAERDGARTESNSLSDVYFGAEYGESEIRGVLEAEGIEYSKPEDLPARVADLLAQKCVVARFDGRMEYGPRALGNRSILYEAKDPSVNQWLNNRLKRTEFMPFAPVTLFEHAAERYVGLSGAEHPAQFMTITFDCTDTLKRESPACVHVDGTARPQLIRREQNPGYYDIIEAYRQRTGIPTVVNTSFNIHEEPIVCTPQDAVRTWRQGHLDALILGPFLLIARDRPQRVDGPDRD